KGKWQERKRRSRRAAVAAVVAVERPEPAEAPAVPRARPRVRPRMPRILSASRQAIKAMSLADAAREIDALGDGIVVFGDVETAAISVLYGRRNGELTLLETEA